MSARAWTGLAFLAAIVAVIVSQLHGVPGIGTLATRVGDHISGRMIPITVAFDEKPPVEVGDAIYSVEDEAFALQGRITAISANAPWRVDIELDPQVTRRFSSESRMIAMHPDADLAWVLKTLVPPSLRQEVLADLGEVWQKRQSEMFEALRPHVVALTGDLGSILGEALPRSLQQNRERRDAFFDAFRKRIFDRDLEPILEREFIARLEERLGPLAGEMGAEIWAKVSVGDLMALSWIATKDVFGATEKREMAKRLSVLLESKALPVFKQHAPTAFRESMAALMEGLEQPHVVEALDKALKDTMGLKEFQEFIAALVDSWIVENTTLHERLIEALESEKLRAPIDKLWKAAEPELESALTEILTRADRQGMDHQLVRVLRRVVLRKDRSYLVIEGIPGEGIPEGGRLTGVIGEDR